MKYKEEKRNNILLHCYNTREHIFVMLL